MPFYPFFNSLTISLYTYVLFSEHKTFLLLPVASNTHKKNMTHSFLFAFYDTNKKPFRKMNKYNNKIQYEATQSGMIAR